jgi:hypothetical protein
VAQGVRVKQAGVTQKSLWRGALVAVLSVALAAPAPSDKPRLALRPHLISPNSGGRLKKVGDEIVIGIVVVAVAVGVLVIVLIVHYRSKKRAITGCVRSGATGLNVTDEKDKRIYVLSGDTAGVKPGDRMTLEGKPKQAGKTLVFEAQKVTKDFGACQP